MKVDLFNLFFVTYIGNIDAGEMSPSAADTTSLLSVDTCVGNDDSSVTKLTPMKNSEVGALIPLSHNGQDDVMSDDSMSIKSFGDDQDYASAMSSVIPSIVPTPQPMTSTHQYHKRQSSVSSVASATSSTLSREDLKVSIFFYCNILKLKSKNNISTRA